MPKITGIFRFCLKSSIFKQNYFLCYNIMPPKLSSRRRGTRSKPQTYRRDVSQYFGSKQNANPRNMKKTTQRGAYSKPRKKQMAIRRAPLVETFKYQSAPNTNSLMHLSTANAFNIILNQAFCCGYTQGLDIPTDGPSTSVNTGPTCRGRDVFSKLTAMKLRFDFPENDHMIRTNYTPPQVIHGWVKKTMFKTSDTSPIPIDVVEQTFIDQIKAVMENQFDDANDKLDFVDKRTTEYVILGRKNIKPNRNKMIEPHPQIISSQDPATDHYRGALPPVFHTIKWNVNRKIGLQMSMKWVDSAGQGPPRFYPATCWIPFCVVYNPSFGKQNASDPPAGQIAVSYNSVHYYTDS